MKTSRRTIGCLAIGILTFATATNAFASDWPACQGVKISLLRGPDGGRVDWSPAGDRIAFDSRTPGKVGQMCFDIYQMKTDGSNATCLTCGRSDIPFGTEGNPAYYPDGRYIVFQSEKASHPGLNIPQCSFFANPGVGLGADLRVIDTKTGKITLLYTSAEGVHGTLHPHFSPDGKMLLWSEIYPTGSAEDKKKPQFGAGKMALKIGDVSFAPTGEMELHNVRQLFPTAASGEGMAEAHGFTPDSKHIIFSGNLGYTDSIWLHTAIMMADLDGKNLHAITDLLYNEHGQVSPSGKKIAWMSSAANKTGNEHDGTEFFLMDMDGRNRCQLSHFNTPGYPESRGEKAIAADLSWSPDGKALVAYTHNRNFEDLANFHENIWLIKFDTAQ